MTVTERDTTAAPRAPRQDLAEARVDAIQDTELLEHRREQILDAALALFLEKGYASTTIRDICARAAVSPASLYDYVANKHDVLRRLLNRLWFRSEEPTLQERLADPSDPPLERILDDYFRQGWRRNRLGTVLAYRTVPHLDPEDRRILQKREHELLEALARHLRSRSGAAEDDPRAEVIANFIIFTNAFGPLRDWLTREVDDDVARRTIVAGIVGMVEQLSEPPDRG